MSPSDSETAGALRCVVSGRVQGVFFRASAQEQARALGLSGYARNLPDGRVEVLACGERGRLDAFRDWLRRGPPMARVDDLECQPVTPPAGLDDFRTA